MPLTPTFPTLATTPRNPSANPPTPSENYEVNFQSIFSRKKPSKALNHDPNKQQHKKVKKMQTYTHSKLLEAPDTFPAPPPPQKKEANRHSNTDFRHSP